MKNAASAALWVALGLGLTVAGCDAAGGDGGDAGPGGGMRDARVLPRDSGPRPMPPPIMGCDRPAEAADVSSPDHTIGSGTPESCTASALAAAVSAGGTIVFDCGDGPATITLTESLVVTRDVTLDGAGTLTISGGGSVRIFDMNGNYESADPHLRLQHVTLADGRASGAELRGGGGAIYFEGGRVTAVDVTFERNRGVEAGPDVGGGAVFGLGVGGFVGVDCRFFENQGASAGAVGILGASIEIVGSVFHANVATGFNGVMGGNGGAIAMDGRGRELRICGSTFTANSAGALGGAIFRTGYATEVNEIHLSVFDGNEARDRSGAEADLASGAGALYLQGVGVVITRSAIIRNRARAAAGIWILGHAEGPATGTLYMENVTLAGNTTYERAEFTERGVSGAISMGDDSMGEIVNCTIVLNHAQFGSGIWNATPLLIRNTIISNIADNEWTPLNCSGSAYASPPGMGDHNVQWPTGKNPADDMDCTPGITRADPMMGSIGDHGGPTPTVLPGATGLPRGTDCPAIDQRGEPRDTSDCAIGAVEQ